MILLRKNPSHSGYHLKTIAKGKIGESTKIMEEVLELQDAEEQNCKIMALNELSDIIGAIDLYLKNKYPNVDISDLIVMSKITQRAFESGARK
jgi:phosphoribosyl-ATP pyrophosphohydrolase